MHEQSWQLYFSHYSYWTHLKERRGSLRRESPAGGSLVFRKPPGTEHQENQGDPCIFRRHSTHLAALYINGECAERVHIFRFSASSSLLRWTNNTTALVKNFMRVLRKHNLLLTFYCSSIKNLLTYCITVWYGRCIMADRERLQLPSPLTGGHLYPTPRPAVSAEQQTSSRTAAPWF